MILTYMQGFDGCRAIASHGFWYIKSVWKGTWIVGYLRRIPCNVRIWYIIQINGGGSPETTHTIILLKC